MSLQVHGGRPVTSASSGAGAFHPPYAAASSHGGRWSVGCQRSPSAPSPSCPYARTTKTSQGES